MLSYICLIKTKIVKIMWFYDVLQSQFYLVFDYVKNAHFTPG